MVSLMARAIHPDSRRVVSRGPEDGDSKERERKLDEAIEMTFPASDPIAVGNPTGTEALTQSVRTTHGLARVVTVFGGSGFLGRRIVGHLRAKGFAVRAASRHPKPQKGDDPQLSSIAADIHDRASIDIAVAGGFGVVNAVSSLCRARQRNVPGGACCGGGEARQCGAQGGRRAPGADFRHWSRCKVAVSLHPGARARRGGGAGGLPASEHRPAGGDVWPG